MADLTHALATTPLDMKGEETGFRPGAAPHSDGVAAQRHSKDAVGVRAVLVIMGASASVGFAFNLIKGFPTRIQDLMWANWEFTYEYGLIRRGLGGTLFQYVAGGLDRAAQQSVVLALHSAVCSAIFIGMFAWYRSRMRGASLRARLLLTTGFASTLLAQFVPTTVLLAGYMDAFIIAFALGGGYLAFRKKYLLSGLCTFGAPLIHDGFVFLWLPVIALVGVATRREYWTRRASALVAVSIPIFAFCIMMALHTNEKAFRMIDALPPDLQSAKFGFLSAREALVRMINGYRRDPAQLPLALPMFALPSLMVAGFAQMLDEGRRWKTLLFRLIVTVSPCSVLLLAWDLSRFLVWSTLGGFFVLMWSAQSKAEMGAVTENVLPWLRNLCACTVGMCTLLAIGGPYLYAYFEHAFSGYPIGPAWLTQTPGAHVSYAWLRLYNRASYTSEFPRGDDCPLQGARVNGTCAFAIDSTRNVQTEPVWLEVGEYAVEIETAPRDGCVAGPGRLTFHYGWRLAPERSEIFDPTTTRATFRLELTRATAAMGRLQVILSADAGCYDLTSFRIRREPRMGAADSAS